MQPGLFPWFGTFEKIALSDIVVHLDHVQWQRRGFLHRFLLANVTTRRWCTLPLERATRSARILDIRLETNWQEQRRSHMDRLRASSGRESNFEVSVNLLKEYYERHDAAAVDLAIASTEGLARRLGLAAEFVRSSSLHPRARKTDLIVELCRRVSADQYIYGLGTIGKSNHYLDCAAMVAAGLGTWTMVYDNRFRRTILQDIAVHGLDPTQLLNPVAVEREE